MNRIPPLTHAPTQGPAQNGAEAARNLLSNAPFRALTPLLERWLTDVFARTYQGVTETGNAFYASLLKNLNIGFDCEPQDLDRIPATGPLLVVANHPFGLPEGIVLGALLSKVRSDVRLLANSLLASAPGLAERIIPVNPFGGSQATLNNRKPLRQCIEWLKSGGVLVVFPAGEVSTMQFPALRIEDRQWTANVARLARISSAPVLPIYFHGNNSPAFHMAGLVHPHLRTFLIPRECFNKSGTEIRLSIGAVIPPGRLAAAPDPTAYVRGRTLMLEARAHKPAHANQFPIIPRFKPAAIIPPQDPAAIAAEIAVLSPDQILLQHAEYLVCIASARQIPSGLVELGRLRETAFRDAGEGTGKSADIDSFDRYYQHLLAWNRETREIVGAYRLAKTDEVIGPLGIRGFYTSTLFRLNPGFYRSISPAIELGRSFVRLEYQKSFQPLLLLWKGIGHYVARNPRYRTLFGPVSISTEYTSSSRALIVSYLKSRGGNDQLAAHIKPRKRFRVQRAGPCDPSNFGSLLSNLDELSEVVADIEPDHKKLPILLRHYLNLGGQILDFSVDKTFSNVLDGLVVLDLAKVSRRQLDRYMGPENASSFLRLHHASLTGTAA